MTKQSDKTTEEKKAHYEAHLKKINEELSKVKNPDDYIEYVKRNNRHTLKVSLLNEQVGEELWEGKEITFFNEDNAISHKSIIETFLTLLTREENRGWGYKHTDEELVERIINPIKQILEGGEYPILDEED